ncbi:MAG TPA: decarboxylating NADP(+)-dependent phosphogluconate dehydrogenase [Clostridia bacterium]|nr:decarboxylating NADP(+)-dependent phosphogluconate dehydrogenase [Clostridia bacterium]
MHRVKSDIGLIGLAVMGQNLVLNMESKGYRVSVYNRTKKVTEGFLEGTAKDRKNIIPSYTLEELIGSLKRPRRVMLMIKAGPPVDATIESLLPLLEEGDIIIDGGNSFFEDTVRRISNLKQHGIHYLGAGISGGEEGALEGPSIMPGGSKTAWESVEEIFKDISAKVDNDIPCCDYIGPGGSGHYVKMVHNGIEYGDMQLISEAYYFMKEFLGMSATEMQDVFVDWNDGELNSYLIEITSHILGRVDQETGRPLVDVILDRAGNKGTGKWTSQEALELGTVAPTIVDAVFARYLSSVKEERMEASKVLEGPQPNFDATPAEKKKLIHDIGEALFASKICSYAQGFQLLKRASEAYGWELNLGEIALLWREGCIIRAQFLNKIKEAYDRNPDLNNLMLDSYFRGILHRAQSGWRRIISLAVENGIPVSSFSSALAYFDGYRRETLSANMIQAQRDYFGAHTYERTDKEGTFHTEWLKD